MVRERKSGGVTQGAVFRAPGEGGGSVVSLQPEVSSVSQRQSAENVSADDIPVDIADTQSDIVEPDDVPKEIESVTRGLASERPPTNPIVVLKAARWWYIHGKGGTDPAFQWAIEWTRHLATDTPSNVERFDDFLEYLVTVGSLTRNRRFDNLRATQSQLLVHLVPLSCGAA